MLSDFTSVGCHTSLWDYRAGTYHRWVKEENLTDLLPPLICNHVSTHKVYQGTPIVFGVGIHDSSAAAPIHKSKPKSVCADIHRHLEYYFMPKVSPPLLARTIWSGTASTTYTLMVLRQGLQDCCWEWSIAIK